MRQHIPAHVSIMRGICSLFQLIKPRKFHLWITVDDNLTFRLLYEEPKATAKA